MQVCSTPSPCNSPNHEDLPKTRMLAEVMQVCATPSPCNSPNHADLPKTRMLTEVRDPIRTEFATSEECTPLSDHRPSLICMGQLLSSMPPPCSPPNVVMLAVGTPVEIDGLLQRPDFNGKSGTVQSWDPVLRRYNILLDGTSDGSRGPRQVKTKRENLRLRPPPPPLSAAAILATTIDLDACIASGSEDVFLCVSGDVANLDGVSQSPSVAPESPGWFPYQYCEASGSPQGWNDATRCDASGSPQGWNDATRCDASGSPQSWHGATNIENEQPGAAWDYSNSMLTPNEMISGFDSPDHAGWQQHQLCDADGTQGGWQQTY